MMKEKKEMEICEIFDNAFSHCREQKIAIYGIGENTKTIVENLRQYHIIGLLDGVKKCGTVYGFPLLDECLLSKDMVDIIVIIARSSNVGIILKRIARICIESGIEVYDIQGSNLLNRDRKRARQAVPAPDRDALLRKIREADVISFDIFDTLIMRKLLFPADVFELMKKYDSELPDDFPAHRMKSERVCMQENAAPTIHAIYIELQKRYGWTDKQTEHYKELEFSTDCKCMLLRKDIFEIYQECCSLHKKMYFISDMYYSKAQIDDILKRFQIREYEDILVSCEKGTSKSGHLFDYYLKAAPQGKKLHIGDDEDADICPARIRGIDTYLVLSARKMLEFSCYGELEICAESLLERVIVGCFIARIFNSPFDIKGSKGILKRKDDYGYLFLGPLVLKFCLWMIGKAEKESISNILFSARDGYVIKKVYEYLKDNSSKGDALPDSTYLYASRAAYVSMSLFDLEDIRFAYELAYDGSPAEMLRERFKLPEEEIEEYDAKKYPDSWIYIVKHSDKIISRASCYRAHFWKYVSAQNMVFDKGTAYFDFVSSGTCQRCLQKVTGKRLKGYYFSNINNKCLDNILEIDELFHNQLGLINDSFLCKHYLFMESVFSSPEPTLMEFDEEGRVLFLEEVRTKAQLTELEEIQEGILAFVRDVIALLNGCIEDDLKKEISDMMLSYILKDNTEYAIELEGKGILVDEFCHRIFDVEAVLGDLDFNKGSTDMI